MSGQNPLKDIFDAESVAFYGASNRPTAMGTQQCSRLVKGGFEGRVYPVHPKEATVLGLKAYRSADELPEVPDLAMMVLPTGIVPEKMLEIAKKGIKRAIIISGGFKERGNEGRTLEERVKAIAREHGIRFIGPNCIGIINAKRNFNVTFFPYFAGAGNMGLISQSGTYVTQVLPHLERRGMAYSKAMSLGNEADIDIVDGLEYLGDDPDTAAIAMYIETIRRGREFIEAARRASLKKPVVAYFVGGTEMGARSGMSHTGAMGGNDEIYGAVFKQCGVIRAPAVEEMYDWAWALANQPLPKGRRVAIVSQSGGPVTSMADACGRAGLELPLFSDATQQKLRRHVPPTGSTANPVDLTFHMQPNVMTDIIPNILLDAGEVDGLLIHGLMSGVFIRATQREAGQNGLFGGDPQALKQLAAAMNKGIIDICRQRNCPVIVSSFSGREDETIAFLMENDVPCMATPEKAVYAFKAMVDYMEWRKAGTG